MLEAQNLLSREYLLEDVHSATVPWSRLGKILNDISQGKRLSTLTQNYLESQNLVCLLRLSNGDITKTQYVEQAKQERDIRAEAALKAAEKAQLEKLELQKLIAIKQAEMWAAIGRNPDQVSRNKKNKGIRERFDIYEFIDSQDLKPLMAILRRLDSESRLTESDTIWLTAMQKKYSLDTVFKNHHRLEADFFLDEYQRTSDIWKLVSASGHLRRCDRSGEAQTVLGKISSEMLNNKKLKSAFRTTQGGVMRDLDNRQEALKMAEEAHMLQPLNYRPCTLIGALKMEEHSVAEGHEWYEKAKSLGAPSDSVDADIRATLRKMKSADRQRVIKELLAIDSAHYKWLRAWK